MPEKTPQRLVGRFFSIDQKEQQVAVQNLAQELGKVLKTPISDEGLARVVKANWWYLSETPQPRLAERKAALEQVKACAGTLLVALAELDDTSRMELSDASLPELERLVSILHMKLALHSPPEDKGGARPDIRLRWYIQRLHDIYEKETGSRATASYDPYCATYTGPFVQFVCACIKPIDPDRCKPARLGKAIQRALTKDRTPLENR